VISKSTIGVATAALALGAWSSFAQSPPSAAPAAAPSGPSPADKAIEYRQAVYKIIGGNFPALAQAAQGKTEFKADLAAKQATRVAQLAAISVDAYPDISKEGKTRALPAIWTNRKEFDALVADFVKHSQTLAEVTANSSSAGEEFKAAVAAVGNDCKTCHDKFRSK
jgi:cytochrome c556